MELIDKSKLEKQMKEESLHLFNAMYNGYSKAMKCVKQQPTAFDVDKVVEQLEEVEKIMTSPVTKDCFGEECRASDCTVCLISKAIEIVKGGGVE